MEQRPAAPSGFAGLDARVRRRPWVADVALAAALTAVLYPTSVTLLGGATWPTAARVAVLATVLVGHLTVAARRRWPVPAYAVCCAVMLVLVLAPDVSDAGQVVPPILLPSALVYPVLLFAVAAYTRAPWPMLALLVGLVGAVLTTARLWLAGGWAETGWVGDQRNVGWGLFVLASLVAAVLAPWGLGRFRGIRAAYVEALEERARRAEQDRVERAAAAVAAERARISREMHDVVAHSLAVIVRQAEGGRYAAARDPGRAGEVLAAVAQTGREALADMRSVLAALRDDDPDVAGAPQPALEDVAALVERVGQSGLAVRLVTTGEPLAIDRATSLAAYRVVQEALTNVVKHAGPQASAVVEIVWGDGVLGIQVSDDGVGPGAPAEDGGRGQGLVGMRERVSLAGGTLRFGPRETGRSGSRVRAELPVRVPERQP